jgi:hypothetical protein
MLLHSWRLKLGELWLQADPEFEQYLTVDEGVLGEKLGDLPWDLGSEVIEGHVV